MDEFGDPIDAVPNLTPDEARESCDSLLSEFFIAHNIPFAVVLDPRWSIFMQRVQRMPDFYRAPSYREMSGQLLDVKFNECINLRNRVEFLV